MMKKHVKKPTISVAVRGERVYVVSNDDILMSPYTQDIAQYKLAEPGEKDGRFFISLPTKPLVAFMLRHTLKKCRLGSMDEQSAATLKELADKVPLPYAKMDDTGKRVRIIAPMLPHYRELFRKVDAAPKGKGEYTVPVSRAVDLYTVALASKHKYPPIRFHEDVEKLFSAPIPGFDGSIDSLKAVPTSVLNVVSNNVQSPKSRSASKSTLAEKLESVGISSLYDLLFELPRRYVDKSAPSKIHELIVGQDATVIGKIASLEKFNSGKGLNIDLDLHGGGTVRVSFFAGGWMENKYKEDSEVIVTGKYKPWRNLKQISGSTIEFADSAATLPVTPIYSQSESKGITTTVISRAVQELIYRLGHVELPFYLREVERAEQKALEEKEAAGGAESDGVTDDEGKDADSADTEANIVERRRVVKKTYAELIRAVHFPRNMKERDEAVKRLAFYELIEMQIVIQGRRKSDQAVSRGIVHKVSDNKAYASALNNLPFELTGAQKRGMEKMEKGMTSESPYHVLLNADVGAGKGLPEDEVVLTPRGFVPIKNINVGDEVIGSNGKPTKVTGVYPQGYQDVAEITFSDKTKIVTDMNHLWELTPMAQTGHFGGARQNRVVSTGQLLSREPSLMKTQYYNEKKEPLWTAEQKVHTYFKSRNDTANRWKLPLLSSPVEYEQREGELPVDPYLLGYWLGDGDSNTGTISVWAEDQEEVSGRLAGCWPGSTKNTKDKRGNNVLIFAKNESTPSLTLTLRKMNLIKNKHIPDDYLHSTPEVRLALLQGLMDSDGSVSKRGTLEFYNSNVEIVRGFVNIVRSLGGVATVSDPKYKKYRSTSGEAVRSKRASYIVTLDMPFGSTPFCLNRKVERYGDRAEVRPKRAHKHRRAITHVEKMPEQMKTICIKVDAEDELFVTKDFLVTHNTVVATLASLIATDSGGQTVIVAPTEILARQLYQNVLKTKETLDEPWKSHLTVDFLTGSLKAKEKKEILQRVKSGETNVIVGTKSAMAKDVEYEDLSLVVIDEQQKFGAEDRSALLSARNDNKKPDLLMMTATPIPRSTAQVFYGDMDFIYLDEKPGGRLPIITEWVQESPASVVSNHVHRVWSEVKDEVDKGNQAFVIAPLVEDSEKIDASSVNATYESLKSGALAGVNIGVVHGKMKSAEAEKVMQDFKDGVYSVLIASTVVEVGVDINSATAMVVLSADRLGASTLHQIRGRVGRNSMQSKCYLVADEVTDSGAERLQSLVDSDDGYEIAKADLVLRGEGKLFQSSQSGKSEFVFLKLARHGRWVSRASDHARNILDSELGKPAAILAAERFEGAERFV